MEKQAENQGREFKHLVRVANTDLKGEKAIISALQKIKGVNFMFANMVCNLTQTDKSKKTGYLEDDEVAQLDKAVQNPQGIGAPVWMLNRRKDYETGEDKHLLLGDLDFTQSNDVKRLKMIKAYRGVRHMSRLPCRGQRTKSNFRRNKGKVQGVKKTKGQPAKSDKKK
jgi:small subunit ribosomal protein S13